jgi:hypothetical protein
MFQVQEPSVFYARTYLPIMKMTCLLGCCAM